MISKEILDIIALCKSENLSIRLIKTPKFRLNPIKVMNMTKTGREAYEKLSIGEYGPIECLRPTRKGLDKNSEYIEEPIELLIQKKGDRFCGVASGVYKDYEFS